MSHSPFGFFARFLSFTAASIACAAIASAGATQAASSVAARGAVERPHAVIVEPMVPAAIAGNAALSDYPLDRTLIARAEVLDGLNGGLDAAIPGDGFERYRPLVEATSAPLAAMEKFGLPLPHPGRVMSIFATIGLVGFFFARRLH